MSTVSELFTPGSQYRSNGAKTLTFNIPARTTAIVASTIQFVAPASGMTYANVSDMTLTGVTGQSWQLISAKYSSNGDGCGIWAWHYRNDTNAAISGVQVSIDCPTNIDYNPTFDWMGMAIAESVAGTPSVVRNPVGDSYTAPTAGTSLSASIAAAGGGRAIAITRQDQAIVGTPVAGSTLLGTGYTDPNNYTLAMYYRTTDETLPSTVTVGSSDTGVRARVLALSFPDPAAAPATTNGGFLSILSRSI